MVLKLTKNQIMVLKKMIDNPVLDCAYDLKTSMNTMYALLRKGLIRRTNYLEVVWFGRERTEYKFTITERGKLEVSRCSPSRASKQKRETDLFVSEGFEEVALE